MTNDARQPVKISDARPDDPGLYWISNGGNPDLVELREERIFMKVGIRPIAPGITLDTRWMKYRIGDERDDVNQKFSRG